MTLYTAIITLVLIMDPFGNIPLFLSTLKAFSPERRRKIIIRESVFAFIVLVFFLFFGRFILQGLHISQPALSVSGGIILFLIAIRMIFPEKPGKTTSTSGMDGEFEEDLEEPLFVPLAVPMQAGPSAMAFIILSSSQYPNQWPMLLLALFVASVICTTILTLSDFLRKLLGNQALRAIERLMGMILTTMAIQMLLTGIKDYLG